MNDSMTITATSQIKNSCHDSRALKRDDKYRYHGVTAFAY